MVSQIKAIKKGDEKAFTIVFNDYYAKLYHYFLKKTKSEDIATEMVQIVFIKLWTFKHTLTESCPFDTQLFNIARTSLIDFIRKKAVLKAGTISLQQYTEKNLITGPDTNFETEDYFNSAIQSLPPVRKKIFTLSRIQGLSYNEIAQYLSISINTVEDHMSKAIRQIKNITTFFW